MYNLYIVGKDCTVNELSCQASSDLRFLIPILEKSEEVVEYWAENWSGYMDLEVLKIPISKQLSEERWDTERP